MIDFKNFHYDTEFCKDMAEFLKYAEISNEGDLLLFEIEHEQEFSASCEYPNGKKFTITKKDILQHFENK